MRFGLCYFPTHDGIAPARLASAAEERGFASLLLPEHTHIPSSRQSPYPEGGDLPRNYVHTYDPFVASTAALSATTTLRVGTGVALLIQRDPITTAKEAASVDHISGGRFFFGVGAGWNREEMANHGTNPRTRMRLLRERVLAMKELWAQEEAEFHGEFVDFEPSWSWPKPIQSPLPVHIGGMGPTVEERILEYGDGWLAQAVDETNIEQFAERLGKLRARAADIGRTHIPVTLFAASPKPSALRAYADAGIDEVSFLLPDDSPEALLTELDRFAELF